MTLSSAMKTLSAWSRDSLKVFSLDLRRNPVPLPAPKTKVETQAAHYALKTIRANTHAKLMAEVGR